MLGFYFSYTPRLICNYPLALIYQLKFLTTITCPLLFISRSVWIRDCQRIDASWNVCYWISLVFYTIYIRSYFVKFCLTFRPLQSWMSVPLSTWSHLLLYSHLQHHNDTINKQTHAERRRETSLTIFYLSLYCKGSKGLFKGCMWEGAGDRT